MTRKTKQSTDKKLHFGKKNRKGKDKEKKKREETETGT
jgi:hypothetical protein